jgi:hypothetical protein
MAHFLAYPISDALSQKTYQVMENLREAPGDKAYRKALIDIVNELADVGLDHFFVKSLKHANMGFLKIKTAEIGLTTFKNGLKPILKSLVNGMGDKQIIKIVDFMEGVVVEAEG